MEISYFLVAFLNQDSDTARMKIKCWKSSVCSVLKEELAKSSDLCCVSRYVIFSLFRAMDNQNQVKVILFEECFKNQTCWINRFHTGTFCNFKPRKVQIWSQRSRIGNGRFNTQARVGLHDMGQKKLNANYLFSYQVLGVRLICIIDQNTWTV